jgi:hypothetical protein
MGLSMHEAVMLETTRMPLEIMRIKHISKESSKNTIDATIRRRRRLKGKRYMRSYSGNKECMKKE